MNLENINQRDLGLRHLIVVQVYDFIDRFSGKAEAKGFNSTTHWTRSRANSSKSAFVQHVSVNPLLILTSNLFRLSCQVGVIILQKLIPP